MNAPAIFVAITTQDFHVNNYRRGYHQSWLMWAIFIQYYYKIVTSLLKFFSLLSENVLVFLSYTKLLLAFSMADE